MLQPFLLRGPLGHISWRQRCAERCAQRTPTPRDGLSLPPGLLPGGGSHPPKQSQTVPSLEGGPKTTLSGLPHTRGGGSASAWPASQWGCPGVPGCRGPGLAGGAVEEDAVLCVATGSALPPGPLGPARPASLPRRRQSPRLWPPQASAAALSPACCARGPDPEGPLVPCRGAPPPAAWPAWRCSWVRRGRVQPTLLPWVRQMGFKETPSPSTFCSSPTPASFSGCWPVVPRPPQPLLESSASADGRGLPLGPESPPVWFQWVLEGSRLRGRSSRRAATARPSPRTWAERRPLLQPPSCRPRGGAETVPSPPPPVLKRVNFFKPHLLSYCLFSGSSSNFRYPPQIWLGSPVIPERSAIHL